MFKFEKDTTIYVVCPAFYKSGGPELLHQLVHQLNLIGRNAVITYYGCAQYENPLNPSFKEYVDTYVTIEEVDDNENNIIVFPEALPFLFNKFRLIQKCIWWMSVDGFYSFDFSQYMKKRGFIRAIKYTLFTENNVKLFGYTFDKRTICLYQSAYARDYLIKQGVTEYYKLSDYINDIYLNKHEDNIKRDIVIYNPKKGIEFTRELIAADTSLKWVPIQNMTNTQVQELLRTAKVYVDFGSHPGKDRIPREAAASGCCIITGRRGAAKFFEDIPIDEKYKFDEKPDTIPLIINTIKFCILNYGEESKKFDSYRNIIAHEHEMFIDDVKMIFG